MCIGSMHGWEAQRGTDEDAEDVDHGTPRLLLLSSGGGRLLEVWHHACTDLYRNVYV